MSPWPNHPASAIRKLRQQLGAVAEYVDGLHAPIREGYWHAPVIIEDCFDGLLGTLDEFDRQLAKLDGTPGAVGGEMALREGPCLLEREG